MEPPKPGSWFIEDNDSLDDFIITRAEGRRTVCQVHNHIATDPQGPLVAQADARLIAAAPDLRAAAAVALATIEALAKANPKNVPHMLARALEWQATVDLRKALARAGGDA